MNSGVRIVDGYTKVVLTIIAAALCVLIGQNMVSSASAFGNVNCGGHSVNPCWMRVEVRGSLD